jgi:putative toxin-antitoxin system antitoxin component (TIGR02293 family)
MKAAESVLDLVVPGRKHREKTGDLIDLKARTVPWSSIKTFSKRLGIEPTELLRIIGVTERTALRRKTEGYLKPAEADRLLRIGRILEEALRVFGTEEKAVGWLNDPSPFFYDNSPLSFLDSDAGTQAVTAELVRIDYGEFA